MSNRRFEHLGKILDVIVPASYRGSITLHVHEDRSLKMEMKRHLDVKELLDPEQGLVDSADLEAVVSE